MPSAEREVFSVSVYVGGHMRLLPLNLPAAYSTLREKIIFFSLFVSGSLGGSTGKPFLLNLPAANSPLVSLWSTSLGSTCLRHPTCLRQVGGGAALLRSHRSR